MMKRFLTAKHWQLFIFTFALPMICQFILVGTIASSVFGGHEPSPETMLNYLKIFPLISMIFTLVFFGWFWSIATKLSERIPEHLKLKIGWFKLFLFIPLTYIIIISVFIVVMMNGIVNIEGEPNFGVFGIIAPFHFFAMFCIFYCLFFVAKTIKTAELQKEVRFSDFAGEFFLIWLFPIGVWLIQPKVNKIMEE